MEIKLDVEKLREVIVDYYGTAMAGGAWPAVADLSEIEVASPEKLISIAEREGMDLRTFEVNEAE